MICVLEENQSCKVSLCEIKKCENLTIFTESVIPSKYFDFKVILLKVFCFNPIKKSLIQITMPLRLASKTCCTVIEGMIFLHS